MPVILEAGSFDAWLDRSAGPELLKPAERRSTEVAGIETGEQQPHQCASLIDRVELAAID